MTTLWINSFVLLIVTAFSVAAVIGIVGFIRLVKRMFGNNDL